LNEENTIPKLSPVEYNPFEGPEIARVAPTIDPQLEIWVSCLMGGEDANRSYNESVSLLLTGPFNRVAMQSALQDLINRHEGLRSAFSADGKQICVYRAVGLSLIWEDLSTQEERRQHAFIRHFAKKDAEKAFDVLNGPLFRMALFKLGEEKHYLTITVHHIVCDGWSLGILLQDLGKLYCAYAKKEVPDLPAAESFSQYALEQKEFSLSAEYRQIEQYWVDQFKDNVPVLDMPTDFARSAVRTYKSHRDDFSLDPQLVGALKKLGQKAGCSFVTTLLASFEVFLMRITGQNDIVLGLPAAGQAASGKYALVGHCVNLLPLRSHPAGDLSFIHYLKQRKKQILDDYDHQHFTFSSLLKKLNIPRDASRVPLVPVVFNIDLGLDDGVSFYGLQHQMFYNPREYENFELFLNASGSEQSFVLEWSYNSHLFKASTIKRMMNDFESLLRAAVANPDLLIKDIPSSSQEELQAKLKRWNDTFCDYPDQIVLTDLIDEQAASCPNRIAMSFRGYEWTYRELVDQARGLAALLQRFDLQPGDIIALAMDRSAEMVLSLLAIMKSGAAYLPLDPDFPPKRVAYMLADARPKVLLTSRKYRGRFTTQATELLIEDALDQIKLHPEAIAEGRATGQDLAYVLYTSGSTGNPKAVQIQHRSLVNFVCSMQKAPGIESSDRLLAVTTISFDIAGLELYLPLVSGAQLIVADQETARDGRLLCEAMQKERVSIMQATPSTWKMILDAGWHSSHDVKVLCGGEALPKELADKLLAQAGSLWNMYGPTETTIWSCVKQVKATDEIITIGHPIDNTQVYILDKYLRPLPVGYLGEIYIGGAGVSSGYLNRPDLTAERFADDPFGTTAGGKIYRTGDLGKFLENGEIQCLGRIDQQLKIRGHRIEPREIEQNLEKLEGIKEAVVINLEERLVAYLVADPNLGKDLLLGSKAGSDAPGSKILLSKWRQQLKDILPSYMVPDDFELIPFLPLTPNGKIDRNALPKPSHQSSSWANGFAPPGTNAEKVIAAIWADLLGVEKLSIYDDFFELGGHSLVAVQAMTRLEKETGKRLPLASLFEAPTVEKLAKLIEQDHKSIAWNSLVPIKPRGSKMPLYIVHGFGMNVLLFKDLAKHMDPDQPVFALQAKGLGPDDEALDNMEDIAQYYISEILATNPADSFALAGYSFGGIIVYEMARQLKAKGKKIVMLAMFDTYAENSDYFDPTLTKITKKARRQFPKLLFILRSLWMRPRQTISYQFNFVRRKLNGKSAAEEEWDSKELSPKEIRIGEKYEYANSHYKMVPFDGAIDLFKVKTRLYYLDDMKYMGWKKYAKKGVYVHEISGDHKTFLYMPFAREFARILQQALDERTAQRPQQELAPEMAQAVLIS
jgi:amino acid adenylation domain-containing protein